MKKIIAILLCLVLCVSTAAAAAETWVCPNCGTENDDAFCGECGTKRPEAAGEYGVGDIVTFGAWGGEAIEWQILEAKDDGYYVMMSVKGVDTVPYHTKRIDVTWENCSLRAWMNGTFYEGAFTESEKSLIRISKIENKDNAKFGTEGGNDTEDRVYLLSDEEVEKYFGVTPYVDQGSAALICMPTAYAVKNGALCASADDISQNSASYNYPLQEGSVWWWRRSPGNTSNAAAFNPYGNPGNHGVAVNDIETCVRPVICVKLERAAEAVPAAENPVVGEWIASELSQDGVTLDPRSLGLEIPLTVMENGSWIMTTYDTTATGSWTMSGNTLTISDHTTEMVLTYDGITLKGGLQGVTFTFVRK